jgi:hypothetical protein
VKAAPFLLGGQGEGRRLRGKTKNRQSSSPHCLAGLYPDLRNFVKFCLVIAVKIWYALLGRSLPSRASRLTVCRRQLAPFPVVSITRKGDVKSFLPLFVQKGGIAMSLSDVLSLLALIVASASVLATVAALFYKIGKDMGKKR